ncbi:unnamed protein product [Cylindrotheca closterium]|uniref:Uncharacterized protein n=1 Tax=Cylindrotheca closterium TaxID=2856 RepID=A0AAD2FN93_9STRA|nr:unnamed protein product [Cylindrotheca closterium]
MMLLAEKQFKKTIEGCLEYQGNGTCEWLSREDTASPTALQEAITTTCVIDAHEAKEGEDCFYMKITGMMVQILIDMAPEYRKYVVLENGKFHVDNLMSSHMDPKVNDKFAKWLNMRYGSIKACTIVRGKIHRYLGMTLDFSVKGKLKIRMDDCVKNMFNKDSKQETPAGNDLLEGGKGKLLSAEYRQIFHTTVARGLYVSKRACLDIHPMITIQEKTQNKINSE